MIKKQKNKNMKNILRKSNFGFTKWGIALIATFVTLSGVAQAQVKISQVYGAGGNASAVYNTDYVELYNAGSTAQNLSGWSIQYASAAGTSWSVQAISGTIQPGKYFLISLASSGSVGSALPAPDYVGIATGTGVVNLSASNGKVALANSTTPFSGTVPTGAVDFVGFGTASTYEGTGAAPAPSTANAIFRAGSGATDTNDNKANFSAAAAAPRNSSSGGGSSTPTITLNPTSLTGLTTTAGTASAAQTFTVTGANLSADLTVTAPTGFEVATNGTDFAGSKILTQSAGAVSGTISVRIAASTPQGALASANVTLVSGVTSANVAVSGTVTAAGAAAVSVTGGTLTAFSTVAGTASAAQSFTVSGQNLTSDITVTAPTGFEVSTDAVSYASSKTLTQVSGTVAATTISVRIAASAAAGTLASANVTVSATDVTTANVAVSGTVTQPALTLTLNPTSVAENAVAPASTGTVGIPASLGTDLVVNLVSTNTAAATVPASVTITNGTTNAIFDIAAVSSSGSYQPQTTAIQASNSNYTTASATLTVTNVDVPTAPLAAKGWINEFHYDNTGTDAGEFVEIVLADTTPTANVSIVLYNGGTAGSFVPYGTANDLASFTKGVSANGYTIYSKSFPVDGIQNGGTDGIALIIDNVVEEFISYEGSAVATSGAAAGYTSKDIGISEGAEGAGGSLYRYGPGSVGRDFAWAKATVATPGQVNPGQNLGATGVQGTGTLAIANTTASSPFLTQNIFPKATAGQTVSLTLTGTLSSGTIGAMSVVVPAAFTGLNAGNVTVSGTGAGTPVTTLSGSTLTVTGLVVDQLNPVTINIAGLTTPETETAGDLTKDGNYPFTVQTGVDGNLQPLLIQPIAVVTIPIANLGDVDANGVSLDVGKTVAVQGVCTEENFNSTSSTSAYLQSGQPDGIRKAGINIYSGQRNLFVRGNEYVVTGSVLNYSGLTELVVAASSQVVRLGTATAVPTPVTLTIDQLTAAHEAYEGSLVRVVGLSKVSGTWALTVVGTTTSGSNIILASGGVNLVARLNAGSTALAEPIYPTAITGIYGQFVAGSPYTGGGQIQPRDQADIQDAPGLRLTFAEAYLYESINNPPLGGTPVSGALTVSRTGADTSAALVVALSASPTGVVQFPASVTIPAGQESASVTVEAIDNSAFDAAGFTNVTLTGSALGSGLSNGSTTVMILEDEASAPADTIKPGIALIGDNPLLLANGATYTDLGAKVTDNLDAERTITGSGTVNTAVQGDYTVTYNATDAAGNAADAVTRTVRVAAPVVVQSTYAEWSGGATLDSAGLAKYAIGGASSLAANDGVKPTTALTGGFLVITAIVRTDNSNLTVVGQAVTDLANYASSTGVTTVNGVETTDQTGVPTGHKRKTFSVAQGSDAKKFMRLIASLALSGVNTTVTVAKDSGGATFLQVTGATAGATGGGTATSDKRSIYYYAPDTTSSPTFSGGFWPYVIVQGQLSAGAGVTATLTKNGSGMLLVNGLPAYQFGGDSGSTTASGVSGAWPAMRGDGSKTTTGPSGTLQ